MTDIRLLFPSTGPLSLTFFRLLIFRCICTRQLLAVQPVNTQPLPEIFTERLWLFTLRELGYNRLVHTLLPCNGSGRFINGDFVLIFF